MMKNVFVAAALAFLIPAAASAEVAVTVYNRDLGLVRDVRDVNVRKGVQTVSFDDVAAYIDPSSVHFSLRSPDAGYAVLEQNFAYDLVSADKLLEKYIGREITVERRDRDGGKKETLRGTLLSTNGGITLQAGDRIVLNPAGEISLAKLPDGLVLKPTLSWLLESGASGVRKAEIDYLTSGISWNADYVLTVGEDESRLDLTGWVTVDNRSGATYPDATLKLVAGDVHRAPAPAADAALMEYARSRKTLSAQGFDEKPFFEYHLYSLQRKTTLKNNETKQIEFITAQGVPVRKSYVYDPVGRRFSGYDPRRRDERGFGAGSSSRVAVTMEFRNTAVNGLGRPLPAGRIRVYKQDTDGTLQFVGEDAVDHTPRDEPVRIELGNAFDVTGERVQTDFRTGGDWCEESYSITFRNHKDEPVTVTAVEHLNRWSNWKIQESSQKYEKTDSRTVEFPVRVPADGEKTVTYRVRYWW